MYCAVKLTTSSLTLATVLLYISAYVTTERLADLSLTTLTCKISEQKMTERAFLTVNSLFIL